MTKGMKRSECHAESDDVIKYYQNKGRRLAVSEDELKEDMKMLQNIIIRNTAKKGDFFLGATTKKFRSRKPYERLSNSSSSDSRKISSQSSHSCSSGESLKAEKELYDFNFLMPLNKRIGRRLAVSEIELQRDTRILSNLMIRSEVHTRTYALSC